MVIPVSQPISNVPYPQSKFLDPLTERPAREWLSWLQNPTYVTQTINFIVVNGGTINNTIIGNTTPASGTFTNLTALNGIGGGNF